MHPAAEAINASDTGTNLLLSVSIRTQTRKEARKEARSGAAVGHLYSTVISVVSRLRAEGKISPWQYWDTCKKLQLEM